MLGNSPDSPDGLTGRDPDVSNFLQPVAEEDEAILLGFQKVLKVTAPTLAPQEQISLAAELGVESPPDTPLQEKKLVPNVVVQHVAVARLGKTTANGRVFYPDPKRQEKGKAKTTALAVNTQSRVKTLAAVEKENSIMKPNGKGPGGASKVSPPGLGAGEVKKAVAVKPPVKPVAGTSMSRARLAAKLQQQSKGGPRRVLVDSVEAPAVGKGWRG